MIFITNISLETAIGIDRIMQFTESGWAGNAISNGRLLLSQMHLVVAANNYI